MCPFPCECVLLTQLSEASYDCTPINSFIERQGSRQRRDLLCKLSLSDNLDLCPLCKFLMALVNKMEPLYLDDFQSLEPPPNGKITLIFRTYTKRDLAPC